MFQGRETEGDERDDIDNDSSPDPGARAKPSIGLSLSITGVESLCTRVLTSITDLS